MTDDRRKRTAIALEDFRIAAARQAIPTIIDDDAPLGCSTGASRDRPSPPGVPATESFLTPTAMLMLDDAITDLAHLLTGRADLPECFAPRYAIGPGSDGRLRLTIDLDFDPAGLNRFAAAVKGE